MAMNFGVTPEQIQEISKLLENISGDFLKEVNTMYNTLDDLNSKWEGAGSSGYYNIINSHKAEIQAISSVIGQYSEFLNKAAVIYSRTDNDVASSAGRL